MHNRPSHIVLVLLAVQATFAAVAGRVRDGETGASLAGAMVQFVGLDRGTVTDAEGRYRVSGVPTGARRVVVRRIGYSSSTFDALVPLDGTLEIDVALRPEPIRLPPIEVRTPVEVRGFDGGGGPSFPDRSVSQAAMRDDPLSSEPDAFEALGAGEVLLQPESPSGIQVRGGSSDQIGFALDGIPILNPYHSVGTFSAWNPDALARVDLVSAAPTPVLPDALSGTLSGVTRAPGTRFTSQGSIGTTQSRVTFDGPLPAGAGYLVSLRGGLPGFLARGQDASSVQCENGDWLGKLVAPLLGGRLSLLGYGSSTEIDAAQTSPDQAAVIDPARNELQWRSASLGGEWTMTAPGASYHLRAWSAGGSEGAAWVARDSTPGRALDASRRDLGAVAMVEIARARARTRAGIRAQHIRTFYRASPDSGDGGSLTLTSRAPLATAFVEHRRAVAARGELDLSLAGTRAAGQPRLDPGARFRFRLSGASVVSAGWSRRHQYAQSLRNPESVVSNIFPADLSVAADGARVPVACGDLAIVAFEERTAGWLKLGAQAYARRFDALLVAPANVDPFATVGFTRGAGRARGVSLALAGSGARLGVTADYGLQRVSLSDGDSSDVPDPAVTHSIAAGVIAFPSPTCSIRLGFTGIFGRRTTAVSGPFEWEALNLLDGASDFAGGSSTSGPPGVERLPAYQRLDLGIRKTWRLGGAARRAEISAFGAATNLLGRRNVLTVAVDPSTGERTPVRMRPRSPLVVGIDWRF